jgi:hypothetical protein
VGPCLEHDLHLLGPNAVCLEWSWLAMLCPSMLYSNLFFCVMRVLDVPTLCAAAPVRVYVQDELTKNRCRSKSIDVWQRGVDTGVWRSPRGYG